MLVANHIDEVTQLRMGREVGGKVLYWVAAYLVEGLLIDTGCRHTAEELAEFLEGKYLKLAVNTHHHEDHVGANHILMEKLGIKIFASDKSIPFINRATEMPPYREVVWGYPEPTQVDPLPDRIETDHFRFDVEDDITETVRSMRKLIDLETDKLILFTSAGKVVEDGREALQSCIEYFQDLSQRAKQLEGQGLSAGAIRDKIFGRETSLAGPSEGDFSAENMIRAVLRAEL